MRRFFVSPNLRGVLNNVRFVSNSDSSESSVTDFLDKNEEYDSLASRYLGQSSYNCFIIHPYVKWGPDKIRDTTPSNQLQEAVALIRTLSSWKVIDTSIAPLTSFQKKMFFGKGTLEKLRSQIRGNPNVTAAFINVATLRNSHLTELENEFGVTIFDRYNIVMQILRMHAISTHSRLQVSLAEIPYLRARIRHDNVGVVTGEHYDTRRIMLQDREKQIKSAIKKLKSQRQLLRNRRTTMDFPVVSVIGYTNSGKTSLIKALTGEEKMQPQNQLFATLDVTFHAGQLPSKLKVLYVDTVGFIAEIPTSLIECFNVTLEDAMIADVILHVVDLSSPDLQHQENHVLKTLESLAMNNNFESSSDKIITVGNKCDLVASCKGNMIPVSATKHLGLDVLQQEIENAVLKATDRKIVVMKVPSGGDEMRWLYKNAVVLDVSADQHNSDFQQMKIIVTKVKLDQFKSYFIENKC
ncbi:hypothetical protein PPYR_05652 [Photinus pyralis]|uniref:Hflx-type G domain-containing protein n=2 Tax=Photinus pyralis TaxID=7054 RepID=A0A1Y1M420_PHOPY|nr:putative GTP-binding protein 6 [Photinus pyralis]KAB0801298.1 hypothetical protein PPYR_05652 [Photinus pyralis]